MAENYLPKITIKESIMSNVTALQLFFEKPVESINPDDVFIFDRPRHEATPADSKGGSIQQMIDATKQQINAESIGLTAEEAAREAGDTALTQDLAAETLARQQADQTLQGNIDEEEAAREAGDTALAQALAAEATAREEADNTLQGNIDEEEAAREAGDTALTQDLAAEILARQQADQTLQGNIDEEEAAREAGDTALTQALAVEATAREEADNTLQGNIDEEEAAREAADSVLTKTLANETSARTSTDTTLQAALDEEEAAREAGDTALTQDLAAEILARQQADADEETARQAADTALRDTIDAETTRAETTEAKKVDKHADHANGSTDITNSPDNDGFSVSTTQIDTQTEFSIETNAKPGNPIIGGFIARTAASESIGYRQLLFVNTPSGIQIHIRKNKDIPATDADLSSDDLILNKGEIDALINTIMAALSQGLKTPAVIDKESNLPAAANVPNGTYYVIQQLDVTAPGQQGRAWKNDIISATDWQVVIDNVFAPDDEWISLTDSGALTIHPNVRDLINSIEALTAITGKIKIFNDVVTYATDAHEDILVKRYMMTSDLRTANAFMSVTFDGLVFRVFNQTAGGNLRTDIAASSGSITATIRRNTFYDGNTEGSTHQQTTFTETPTTIDSAIYINSNDYSIYQIMIGNHWWEINLWCADAKALVMMSIERRL
jgi:hypothetical protein